MMATHHLNTLQNEMFGVRDDRLYLLYAFRISRLQCPHHLSQIKSDRRSPSNKRRKGWWDCVRALVGRQFVGIAGFLTYNLRALAISPPFSDMKNARGPLERKQF